MHGDFHLLLVDLDVMQTMCRILDNFSMRWVVDSSCHG
jgi:hypothetical protein